MALTLGGWIFLLVSTISVTALVAWCFWRVLRLPPSKPPEPHIGLGP